MVENEARAWSEIWRLQKELERVYVASDILNTHPDKLSRLSQAFSPSKKSVSDWMAGKSIAVSSLPGAGSLQRRN